MTVFIIKFQVKGHLMLQAILLALVFSLSPVNTLAQSSVRVIQTQQPANQLIDTIAPLYAGQAKLTARNNSLIIRADEVTINEIENLLKELDKPLRNLIIEVASSLNGTENYQQDSVEGRIKVGNDAVISSRAPDSRNPNVSIQYGKNGSVIKTTHTRRSSSRNNPDNFKVRSLEGNWAFIQTGKEVPYRTTSGRYYPYQNSVEFADVTSGFEVYPILNGEQVTLKVRPRNRSLNREHPGQINTRSVDTVVSGQLGQWIYLGGAVNQSNNQSNGTLYSTKRHTDMDMNYRIKVTIVD
ncbi:MAG: hypothetical protein GY694_00570 [Gammaproteobacteria bacterium]|nr:hypothetical protein [Gammaproteobacteria bacterium]